MKYRLNIPWQSELGRTFVIKEVKKCGQMLFGLYEIIGADHRELHTFYEKRFIDDKMDKYLYDRSKKC